MPQQLQMPPKVEYYDVDTDDMRDLRTHKLLTAEQRRDQGYVPFSLWFQDVVQTYVELGTDPKYASAFVAQDLLKPFLQELKN